MAPAWFFSPIVAARRHRRLALADIGRLTVSGAQGLRIELADETVIATVADGGAAPATGPWF